MAGYRIMKLVLYMSVELPCKIRFRIIINAAFGKNVGNLLIYPPFTGTNRANSFEQLMEIIFSKISTVFQAFIIQGKSFDDILFNQFGCPYPELGSFGGIYPITNRYNGVEIVEFNLSLYLTFTLLLNCFQNGNSCLFLELATVINVIKVFGNGGNAHTKQLCNSFLRKPNRLIVQKNFNLHLPVGCCI